ncbi:MAG: DUF4932 domain-containing protein, partial [Candidatus Cloacimonadaceae bacterium]|nr:DUF4932 domain-containing protein [Candidatus Cloacimonadaceae bacterium]
MLEISIDPRIELLAVIQYLSGSEMVSKDVNGYADAIDAWFGDHKEHPVLELLPKMEELGFGYDLPVVTFLQYDSLPLEHKTMHLDRFYHNMNEERWQEISPAADWEQLRILVNSFYIQSDFAGFFLSQQDLFNQSLASAEKLVAGSPDMIAHLAAWFHETHPSYKLVISPLLGGMGYGPALLNEKGENEAYCLLSFHPGDTPESALKNLAYMFFHEFSHSYVNPLVDEHYTELRLAEKLFDPISQKMTDLAYPSWWICVAEHFVRASELRLLSTFFAEQSASYSSDSQIALGFIYIDTILESLHAYEKARDEHGLSFKDYFPKLVADFVALKDAPASDFEKYLLFRGTLNAVTSKPDALIIYPDPQRVEGVDRFILPTVNFLVERLGKEAVTDTQALTMDLSQRHLMLYGTLEDNLWLTKHREILPFQVFPDRIIADKEYHGNNLRIIS